MVIPIQYPSETRSSNGGTVPTILIIDSGVGGLSVYDEIAKLLPSARYLYVFDNAGFPYGTKEESFIIERVVQITKQITERFSIDLAVIACNTASTITLPRLRDTFSFPVIGVVPAIKPAAQLTRNGVIGLLATQGTIRREYTYDLIKQFATNCQIEMLGATSLVELAERKLHRQEVSLDEVKAAVMTWLRLPSVPDTIILGCTHFPLLKEELREVFPKETIFVDSGIAVARRAVFLLKDYALPTLPRSSNIAFCTLNDDKSTLLLPVLQQYRFEKLENLTNIERIA
ncbi:glutamate racemase [Tatumella ptyseos]|uniref:glutamate racemase n=1 Tax=Tatumella ptyseos TaxID=82987 RepID=UPI0026EF0C2B|nr:glutamate racemase [Tatumella ptyseos]WKX26340.1 glutamate racemase [Tatumella ptyseos]